MNSDAQNKEHEKLPGAYKAEILDVDLTQIFPMYELPGEVKEWIWIENAASFCHKENGKEGVWEFVVNLSLDHEEIPELLKPIFAEALQRQMAYIVFHQ